MHDYSQTLAEILGRLHQIEGHLSRPIAEYVDAEQAAVFTSISTVQLAEWRSRGGGPRFIKLGRKVAYRVQDLRDFMEGHGKEAMQ